PSRTGRTRTPNRLEGVGIHGDQAAVEIGNVDDATPGIWYRRRDDPCFGDVNPPAFGAGLGPDEVQNTILGAAIDRVAIHCDAGGGCLEAILPTLVSSASVERVEKTPAGHV